MKTRINISQNKTAKIMTEEPSKDSDLPTNVSDEEDKEIKITVKTHARNEEFSIRPNIRVGDLKSLIAERFDAETSQLCLIYAGRMLNDHGTLREQNVKNGFAIHLVIRNQTTANPTAGTVPEPSPNPVRHNQQQQQDAARINEMTANLLSNPAYIRALISMDPRLQAYLEQNPEIAHAINNPNIMREYLQIASNPNMMQEFLRNQDLSMRNLESIPGGFAALESIYNNLSELEAPNGEGQQQQHRPNRTSANSPQSPVVNSTPLPNPWSTAPTNNNSNNRQQQQQQQLNSSMIPDADTMAQLMNNADVQQLMLELASDPAFLQSVVNNNPLLTDPALRDYLTGNLPSVLETLQAAGGAEGLERYMHQQEHEQQQEAPPETRYAHQLDQLDGMGFTDREANLRALANTMGDINAAIDWLTTHATADR